MTKVTFERVHKAFGAFVALEQLDLAIASGEFVSLLGPSGCGKTTTLRMLAGLEQPTRGTISVGDRVVNELPPAERDLAMVFQSYALYPHMTVAQNIEYPLRKRGVPRAVRREQVLRAAAQLQLEPLLDRKPRQLSGGQQQRVALGRALVRDPAAFLLDEPLSNLDAKLREQMRFELQELISRTGVTTLYVTHDQSEALAMSDTVAVMSAGRIVQSGAPREVYGRPIDRTVADFLGSANFLRGRVVEAQDGVATVALNGGASTVHVPSRAGLAAGATVDVIFRPEDVTTHLDPSDGAIECVLERVVFQGGSSECQLRLGSTALRSVVHPSLAARPGDRAWIVLQPERCILFAAE